MRADPSRTLRPVLLASLISLGAVWLAWADQAADRGDSAVISAENVSLGADEVSIRLRIADDYYLFANKIRVESEEPGVELGEPQLPLPESYRDPFFGEVDVYRNAVDLSVPYRADAGAPQRIALTVHGQGCTDAGDCYPAEASAEADRDVPSTPADGASVPGGEEPAALGRKVPDASESTGKTAVLAKLLELGDGIEIGASGEDEFLDPDVAFVLSAEAAGPGAIEARWDIAEGYYLYRDKFQFRGAVGSDVTLGNARFPKGKIKDDEYFGVMEVYYDSVAALVPVPRAAAGGAIDIDVTYQGCAEAGLCYPPITKTMSLLVPIAMADTGAGTGSGDGTLSIPDSASGGREDGPSNVQSRERVDGEFPSTVLGELPEQDRIAASLVSGNRWLVILSLFGAGLLLTFTPCVLPMVPILTSIIVGQGAEQGGAASTRRAFTLSLVYVLAMALTYTVAGVLAGLFGANLAAAFQDPWIVSAFVLVFVLLALSMFGFYDLQIPASWQAGLAAVSHRQRGGTYAGVAVMGVLSALIVGPCVAAPLAGVLIYIGQTGDPVLGGIALFALGMGMGVPLMVAGVSAGKLLPKAGAWMNAVKAVFGVMLLAVAIYLLERVIPESVALLLWAALFIVCAIYMGALDALPPASGGWRRLWKGSGLVMLVYGVLVMVGVAGGGGDLFRPLKGIALASGESGEHELEFREVKGIDGLNAELGPAAARGQVVMFDYYADWCVSCKEMERFTFSDPGVQAALANVLLLQTDVTANDAADQALLAQYGLFGPPAILFFGPDGRERRELRVVGYMNADNFRRVVERAILPGSTLSALNSSARL